MIKVFYGKKGTGKTVALVETANRLAESNASNVVFINNDNALIYDLNHNVRFINVSEFPVNNVNAFVGFICGILSCNYDISSIFIDEITCILKTEAGELKEFFEYIKNISRNMSVDFYISINGDANLMPVFLKEYV